jgi:hypothetical protein
MADFQFEPLTRDVDSPLGNQVASPRTLEIVVTGGRQLYPPLPDAAESPNRLLIFAGTIQFDQDGDPGEDPTNPTGEEGEVDEGQPRTVELKLRDPENADDRLAASASVASLGNIYLQGDHGGVDVLNDIFGANVSNALAQEQRGDLYLFSDVVAELGSQMNRMPYQVFALVEAAKSVGNRREHHRQHGEAGSIPHESEG